jgi:hypothetical protein
MARRQQDTDAAQLQPLPKEAEQQSFKMDEGTEGDYLERKIENLNFTELELVTRMDPVLERTKRQFDMLGQQSMMLDTLPIDDLLGLQLVRQTDGLPKYPTWGVYTEEWQVEDPLMIFLELANHRAQFKDSFEGGMTDEHIDRVME